MSSETHSADGQTHWPKRVKWRCFHLHFYVLRIKKQGCFYHDVKIKTKPRNATHGFGSRYLIGYDFNGLSRKINNAFCHICHMFLTNLAHWRNLDIKHTSKRKNFFTYCNVHYSSGRCGRCGRAWRKMYVVSPPVGMPYRGEAVWHIPRVIRTSHTIKLQPFSLITKTTDS